MQLTRAEILAFDGRLFSDEDKRALIAQYCPDAIQSNAPASPATSPLGLKLAPAIRDYRRWSRYFSEIPEETDLSDQFQISHDALIGRALRSVPQSPSNLVSDFSGWILGLYWQAYEPTHLLAGKLGERSVAEVRAIARKLIPTPSPTGWRLVYRDPLDFKPVAKRASTLVVDNMPMYGAPDYVFRNGKTGDVLILEVKLSNALKIPSNGWPNVRAQLWAYGYLDEWIAAPITYLVAEVWGFGRQGVWRRQTQRWRRTDVDLEANCRQLFDIYRGARSGLLP